MKIKRRPILNPPRKSLSCKTKTKNTLIVHDLVNDEADPMWKLAR